MTILAHKNDDEYFKMFIQPNISRLPISSSSDSGAAGFGGGALPDGLPPAIGALTGAADAAANFDGSFKNSFS
jgi:hypothetical protein